MRVLLLSVLLAGSMSFADEAPPPEVKRTVDALNGNWSGELTMTEAGKPPVKFKGKWACHKIAAGGAVSCEMNAPMGAAGMMSETDLIGYDVETKAVHVMTWNNMGEVHDHKAAWTDDKTLVGHHTATAMGKPLEENFTFNFPSANTSTFKFTATVDGKASTLEGKMTRRR